MLQSVRNMKWFLHKYGQSSSTNTVIFKIPFIQCPSSAEWGHRKLLRRQERMAEFGFFVLGAVIGVPAALASAIPCRLLISYMMFISCRKTNGVLWLIPARNFSSSLWVRATPPSGISPLRQGRSIPDGGADFFIRNFISRSTENIIWIPDGGAKWPFSFVFY